MSLLIKRQRIERIELVSLTSIIEEQTDVLDDTHEPFNELTRRIELLAELLNCSEEEAEHLLFSYQ